MLYIRPVVKVLALSIAMIGPQMAYSQQVTAGIEEMIVTAQRREQKVTDVPISITAFSEADIEKRGINSLSDFATTAPSVSFSDGGAFGNELKIRGVGAGTQKLSPTTAVYLADVPIVHTGRNLNGSYDFRVVDMKRIEVLNGPQGQLYGANSLGGAVKYIPNAPKFNKFSGNVTLGANWVEHGDSGYDIDAVLNIPLSPQFGARLVGYHAEIGGVYDNVYAGGPALSTAQIGAPPPFGAPPGSPPFSAGTPLGDYRAPASRKEDADKADIDGGRLTLEWRASEQLNLNLLLATERKTVDAVSFAQWVPAGTPGGSTNIDEFQYSQPQPQGTKDQIDLSSLTVNYDFGGAMLTSVTSHWKRKAQLDTDVSYGGAGSNNLSPIIITRDDEPTSFTQEFRLTSQGTGPFQWLAGLFYQKLEQDFHQRFNDASGVDAFASMIPEGTAAHPLGLFDGHYVDKQKAIFGEVKYQVLPTVNAAFSFRYFQVDQSAVSDQSGRLFSLRNPLPPPFTPPFAWPPLISYNPVHLAHNNSERVFTPKYNVTWTPDKGSMYYATVSKGFRTGVVNLTPPTAFSGCQEALTASGFGTTVPDSKSDSLWNYELGTKLALVEKRVQLDASIYRIDWKAMQTHFFLNHVINIGVTNPVFQNQCGFDMITNAGKAQNLGIEAKLTAKLSNQWTVDFAGSAIDAKYKEDVNLTGAKSGDRIQGVPRFQTNVGVEYSTLLAGMQSYARLDWNYVGEMANSPGDYPAAIGNLVVPIGNFSVVNARVGFAITDAISIDAYAHNLGDKRGVTNASDGNGQFGTVVSYIRPRTLGANVRFDF